jgi:hypothetical protein
VRATSRKNSDNIGVIDEIARQVLRLLVNLKVCSFSVLAVC